MKDIFLITWETVCSKHYAALLGRTINALQIALQTLPRKNVWQSDNMLLLRNQFRRYYVMNYMQYRRFGEFNFIFVDPI